MLSAQRVLNVSLASLFLWHGEGTAVSHFDWERGLVLGMPPREHQLPGHPVLSSNTRDRACTRRRHDKKGILCLNRTGEQRKARDPLSTSGQNSSKHSSSRRRSTCWRQMSHQTFPNPTGCKIIFL